jgi:hypothetical protein
MLGLSEQLLVLMFAHLLLAPLNNVSHRLTPFFLNSVCPRMSHNCYPREDRNDAVQSSCNFFDRL